MKYINYFDFIKKQEYEKRNQFFFEGSSPYLLAELKNYLKETLSNIKAIYLIWYLYCNEELNDFLHNISLKGIKIKIISIPLEGYDNKYPSDIYYSNNKKYKSSVTKFDIAQDIYRKNKLANNNLSHYIFPHTFVRSKWMKIFSRGDLPYSLHTKSIYIHYKNRKKSLILSSSNFSMRDKVKEENMTIIESESETDGQKIQPMFNFLRDIKKHIKPVTEISVLNFNNRFEMHNWQNSDCLYVMSPFYKNSPIIIKNKINELISKANKRVLVVSQHLAGIGGNSITESLLKKGREGIDLNCITQTASDLKAGRQTKNSEAFKHFLDSYKLLNSNCHYYVNENIHSKYIIIDDILVISTFNFTPTQFTFIENVKIPRFESNPKLSYEGTHAEVGFMMIVKDTDTIKKYFENFVRLLKDSSSIKIK
jgi:phosphatidylserine/phosphatidylglycerophosphate/cardiolipin synthase-like enzyme